MSAPSGPAGATHGLVPLEGRGDLPFATVHGRPLLEHAVETLRSVCPVTVTAQQEQAEHARTVLSAEVEVCSPESFWSDPPARVLVHDCLCPLVPRDFLERLARADRPPTSPARAN